MPSTNKYDQQSHVEVIEADDLWARFGPKLPYKIPTTEKHESSRSWRRMAVSVAGTAFTLTLHLLFLGTMLLGTAGRKPITPKTEGAAASAQNFQASEFVSTIVMLDSHSITPPDQTPDDSAYAAIKALSEQPKDTLIIASLDQIAVPEISGSDSGTADDSPTAEATGTEAGRAMLFGRYMGQVKARIERAWEYPPTANATKFACKVQIKQGAHGDVQEVTLQQCGNDTAWQTSLVQAIQRASPLSAPPDETVFSEVLTLSFAASSSL